MKIFGVSLMMSLLFSLAASAEVCAPAVSKIRGFPDSIHANGTSIIGVYGTEKRRIRSELIVEGERWSGYRVFSLRYTTNDVLVTDPYICTDNLKKAERLAYAYTNWYEETNRARGLHW
jgi:hypothetical protein